MKNKSKYFIFTLGCQMNISDSERIATYLEEIGYKSAPEKEADLVIVNACSVRQHAVDRIWGKIKIWQNQKKEILITGCVLPVDRKKFIQRNIKYFNINDLQNLKMILDEYSNILLNIGISSRKININFNYFNIKPKMNSTVVYIPIMTGCDNFCSYCAVPFTRGREVSRPINDIITEVKKAIRNGYKDVLLLGQNVNSYKLKTQNLKLKTTTQNLKDNKDFIKLLKTIDNLPGDFEFNFMSSNPHDMGDDLINCFAELKKWPHELHLPLQSGDDEILRAMNRKYSIKQYQVLIENLKLKIKNLKLTTDIIVGFPGETKQNFKNTVKVCQKVNFSKAFIGQYSPRPGTVAAKLKDNVSPQEKKRRWLVLDKLIN